MQTLYHISIHAFLTMNNIIQVSDIMTFNIKIRPKVLFSSRLQLLFPHKVLMSTNDGIITKIYDQNKVLILCFIS